MVQTTKHDSPEDVKDDILKCLDEYNIGMNQIYSFTTDNAANVVTLPKLLEDMQHEPLENEDLEIDLESCNQIESNIGSVFSVVRCVAHAIQLAAFDVMKIAEDDIEECRIVAKKLRAIIRSVDVDISLAGLDVIARWDSTYNMMNKLLSFKEFIESLGSLNTYINWDFIENFIQAFTPFVKCALKLQNEQYVLGDFFRDWLNCELELAELAQINIYATALLNVMRKRKEILLKHPAFVSAIYLDPRFNFNGTPFLVDEHRQQAMDHLLEVFQTINNLKPASKKMERMNSSGYNSLDDIPTTSANAYDKLDLHVQNLLKSQNLTQKRLTVSLKHKLLRLSEGERLTFGTNILEYWRKSCDGDKDMTELVETVLAVPATQVSAGPTFIGFCTILTNLRSKLSNKTLSNLLIVKLNYKLLNITYFEAESIRCNLSNTCNISNMGYVSDTSDIGDMSNISDISNVGNDFIVKYE